MKAARRPPVPCREAEATRGVSGHGLEIVAHRAADPAAANRAAVDPAAAYRAEVDPNAAHRAGAAPAATHRAAACPQAVANGSGGGSAGPPWMGSAGGARRGSSSGGCRSSTGSRGSGVGALDGLVRLI